MHPIKAESREVRNYTNVPLTAASKRPQKHYDRKLRVFIEPQEN